MGNIFRRGSRVYHSGRQEHGTFIDPTSSDSSIVLFDSGRVDGKSLSRDPYVAETSLDDGAEVTTSFLTPSNS